MPGRPTVTVPNRQDEGILADYVLLPEPVATISANIGHMIRNSAAGDPAKRMEIMDALIRTLEQQREWARIAERNTKRKHDVEDNPLLKFARLACGEGGK